MANKYYAVKKGRRTGIFRTWDECKKSVHGYSGSVFRSFTDLESAERYLMERSEERPPYAALVMYTDGSYKDGQYGWGVLLAGTAGYRCFDDAIGFCGNGSYARFVSSANIAGETLAAVKAMEYALQTGASDLVLCYDYTGIREWATGAWKTNTPIAVWYAEQVRKAKERGLTLWFEKIRGHTGNWGNEQADKLAARGVQGESADIGTGGIPIGERAITDELKAEVFTGRKRILDTKNAQSESDRMKYRRLDRERKEAEPKEEEYTPDANIVRQWEEQLKLVGAHVRELRKAAGLTQAKVAEMCDMKQPHVSRIERGEGRLNLRDVLNVVYAVKYDRDDEILQLEALDLLMHGPAPEE